MRIAFTLLLAMGTIIATAQKIKTSEWDKFTKTWRIQTSGEWLKNGILGGEAFAIRSNGERIFIQLVLYPNRGTVVGNNASLIFLLNNDSTVTAYSKDVQGPPKDGGRVAGTYEFEITSYALKLLNERPCVGFRLYQSEGYVNYGVPEKKQDRIQKVCDVFLKEYVVRVQK